MLKSGLCSVTFRKLTAEEVIDLAVKTNLQSIEWGGDIHSPAGDVETAARIGELTRKAGLEVAGYGSYFRCDDPALIEKAIASARAMQAPAIRVWSGSTASDLCSDAEKARITALFQEMCDAAKELIINCEFHRNTLTDCADSTLQLIKQVDRSNFRTSFQIYEHLDNLAEAAALEPFMGNVHVYNYDHAPLAEAEELWQQLIKIFSRHDRTLLLEFVKNNDPDNLPNEAATLQKLLGKQ